MAATTPEPAPDAAALARGQARAWGWVGHLRGGGTTPWSDWQGAAVACARVLPGAQQLELLRRLNESASAGLPDGLAGRVLVAAAPGRGKPDLALVGVGTTGYGPKPVDPSLLPDDELARVATGLLAEDVAALGVSPAPRSRPSISRLWHKRHRIAGDPLEAAALRRHLQLAGRPIGGPRTVVVGAPLDQMLADTWTARCFERGSGSWAAWLRFWRQRGDLPPRIDLPAVVARQKSLGREVRVVLDRAALPGLLGVRRLPVVRRPGADAAELARRVASVLGLLVEAPERAALMERTVLPRMPQTSTPSVAVPEQHRDWVDAAAQRMARQLERAGYPVVGDPHRVVPVPFAAPAAPATAQPRLVLDLAMRLLIDETWKQ